VNKKNLILSILSVVCVALFPCLFLYFQNAGSAIFSDLLEMSGTILLIGSVLLGLNFLIFRNIEKAALLSNIALIIGLYFAFIEKAIEGVFPMLYYWHVLIICFFLVSQIGYVIYTKVKTKLAIQINQVFLLIFGGLILFNGILAIPMAIQAAATKAQNQTQISDQRVDSWSSNNKDNLPNVYYFIFDEYAGFDSIQRYCNYDNSAFYASLEELGFVTSKHSVNDTWDNYTEIPNLLQLARVNSIDMTAAEKKANLKDPFLLKFMKEQGYTVNALDSTNYQFIDVNATDLHLGVDYISTYGTFKSLIFQNTAYYPFHGYEDHDEEISNMLRMFNYAIESSEKTKSNLFTIGYFSFPHVPYIVDENGNKTNDSDRLNLRDTAPYLAQFKYASKKILEMTTEIIRNDPESIIVIQSDHGYRYPSHLHFWYGIDQFDLAVESIYERNILNSVYYQGKDIYIDNYSGINTLITVLNKLLDVDLQMVD
jgi:uncharacterized protein (UPF0333 family)